MNLKKTLVWCLFALGMLFIGAPQSYAQVVSATTAQDIKVSFYNGQGVEVGGVGRQAPLDRLNTDEGYSIRVVADNPVEIRVRVINTVNGVDETYSERLFLNSSRIFSLSGDLPNVPTLTAVKVTVLDRVTRKTITRTLGINTPANEVISLFIN